jgi:hypothetical protein
VKAAKVWAAGSEAKTPRSGLPFFLMPQAKPQAENPLGKVMSCIKARKKESKIVRIPLRIRVNFYLFEQMAEEAMREFFIFSRSS